MSKDPAMDNLSPDMLGHGDQSNAEQVQVQWAERLLRAESPREIDIEQAMAEKIAMLASFKRALLLGEPIDEPSLDAVATAAYDDDDLPLAMAASQVLGDALSTASPRRALRAYQHALALAREMGSSVIEPLAALGLAGAYARTGRTRDAKLVLEDLLETANRDENLPLVAAAHMELTTLGLLTNQLSLSLAHVLLALKYFEYLDDWQGRVESLNALISARTAERKAELIESAVILAQGYLAKGDPELLWAVTDHAARSLLELGNVTRAAHYFDLTLEAVEASKPDAAGWRAYVTGAAFAANHHFDEARRYFRAAAVAFQRSGDEQAAALSVTRAASTGTGPRDADVEGDLAWAVGVADRLADRALAGHAGYQLAMLRRTGQPERATTLLTEALVAAQAIGDSTLQSQINTALKAVKTQRSSRVVAQATGDSTKSNPMLVLISGPSGVGKDTIIEALQRRGHRPEYHYVVTCTTRSRRPNEVDNVSYMFVSPPEFMTLRDAGELLEANEVHGNWYGTPRADVRTALSRGQHAILKIDVQGAQVVKSRIPEALLIFIIPPSLETLVEHLKARRTESAEQLELRQRSAAMELARQDDYDFVVVSEEGRVDITATRIEQIIAQEELRVQRRRVMV